MKKMLETLKFRLARKFHYFMDRPALKDNRAFKDLYKGKRCFIIGSGPSIKDQDITKLKDELTFAMNTFCLHEKYDIIHPKFYVIFHSEYLRGNAQSLEFLKVLASKVHTDTVLVLPLKAKRLFEQHNILPNNKKMYVYVRGFITKPVRERVDMTKTVPTPMGVGVMSLMLALYMGFDPIYLLGMEHSWLATLPKMEFAHFSDDHAAQFFDRNPNESYEENCRLSHVMFRNYRLITQNLKTKIYNLTPNSYIDVFPLGKFEDVIQ